MKRYKLTIKFIGTNYHGWQMQPHSVSVCQIVQDALCKMLNQEVKLNGCSRTDVGVHAEGFVAHIDAQSDMEGYNLCVAANLLLPNDIAIVDAQVVDDSFDARRSAVDKTYLYKIYMSRIRDPFLDIDHMQVYKHLDIEQMRQGAQLLVGTKNFEGFSTKGSSIKGSIRTINYIDIKCDGNRAYIYINGNAFLYNMVRIIVGTLIDIGSGKKSKEVITQMLSTQDRSLGGKTAEGKGLTLLKVNYINQ